MAWSQFDAVRWVITHPLNRNHRVRALVRWGSAQIQAQLGRTRLVPFVDATRLHIGAGLTSANMQHYAGLGEPDIMTFVIHYLRPGDLFVDVGANVGVMTVLAGGVAGARVEAFEPDAMSFLWLKKNITANALDALVNCRAIAVSDTAGFVRMTTAYGAANRAAQPQDTAARVVAGDRLDSLLAHEEPVMIKIDVEGFETPVLRGAERILSNERLQAVVIELKGHGASYGFDEDDVRAMMHERGFSPFAYHGFSRRLAPIDEAPHRPDNVIFLRDLASADARVKSAPRRRVIWDQSI